MWFGSKAVAAIFCVLFAASTAGAQQWPERPIKVIVPYQAGGLADVLVRIVSEGMSETLKQQLIVENRAGAGGSIGSAAVARSAPDGYTLGVSALGTHVIFPAMNAQPPYNPISDFTHIAMFGGVPTVFVVNPDVPARTLGDFLSLLRRPDSHMSYGSSGVGTHGQMIGELFLQKAGVRMGHVPFKGGGDVTAALLGKHIAMASVTLGSSASHIRAGSAIALAVTSSERAASIPEVPTFAELGYPELVSLNWYGLVGPPSLPADIVSRLNKEVIRVLSLPAIQKRLVHDDISTEALTPAEFDKFVRDENSKWAPVIKSFGK